MSLDPSHVEQEIITNEAIQYGNSAHKFKKIAPLFQSYA